MPDRATVEAVGYADGDASGPVLFLTEPLNAWGGLDPATGLIVHAQHPQRGQSVAGKVLVLEETRGSGTNAQVLAEAWANGVGPAAVVLGRPDSVLMVGAVVGRELYAVRCPVVVLGSPAFNLLRVAWYARVVAAGEDAVVTYRRR